MAVPSTPTVTSIVTQALKRAGRTTPTATQITEATDHALQEVKADIMLKAATHPLLLTTATTVLTYGQQRYGTPADYNLPYTMTLLLGPAEWSGTAQGASPSAIILAANFTSDAPSIIGRYLLITGGQGVEEYHQILAWDNTTKLATIEGVWGVTPISGSTYLIINDHLQLFPSDVSTSFDRIRNNTALGCPQIAATYAQEILLYPVPDNTPYGLLNRYYVDLSSLDETGALFVQLLREWRSLFIQGIAVKTMQRFDEDRYQLELSIYENFLGVLSTQTCQVTQVGYRD